MKKDLLVGGVFIAFAALAVGAAAFVFGSRDDPGIPSTIKPRPEPIAVLHETALQQDKKKAVETIRKIAIKPVKAEPEKKKDAETTVVAKVESAINKEIKPAETKKVELKPEPPQPPVKVPDVIELGNIRKINRPAGAFTVEQLDGEDEVTLLGKVKTLRIVGGAKGRSTLDASALEAQEIILSGDIGGSARMKLNAAKGNVVLRSLLAGNSQVEIEAPDGKVVHMSNGTLIATAGARLSIVARDVELNGGIDGGAQVHVTLTKDGSLKFSKLFGGARLRYAKANARDPEPRLNRGEVLGGAQLRKLDPVRR